MAADIFRDMPDLTVIRTAVVRLPEFVSATLLDLPADGPDGTFTATLKSGAVIRVDLTIETPRPEENADDAPTSTCGFCGAGIILLGGSWTEDEDGTIACTDTSAAFVPHKPKDG